MISNHQGGERDDDGAVGGRAGATVELYWIPLGAGTPVVQFSGRVFETISAWWHRRARCDLYHAALQVRTPDGRFSIEQAPEVDADRASRGVVATGPVGLRPAGRLRVFRYEVRCWRDGTIPDIAFAVDSPVTLSAEADDAVRIIDELPGVPTLVWGRTAPGTADMWNSNSVVAWVLTSSGIDIDGLRPPPRGRAPGWVAGRLLASTG